MVPSVNRRSVDQNHPAANQQAALANYRRSPDEITRTRALLNMVPKGLATALDIGARDGHFSQLLTDHFELVTALDLTMPAFDFDRVRPVQGDVTDLQFPDNSFDVVFCAEVLEHVPALQRACAEISRVARHAVVIGVPYRQDTRCGRTTCPRCGKTNPPWGHVNTFDERKMAALFPQLHVAATSFVGSTIERTNPVSAYLLDVAGNPWGVYDQQEPCIHCGGKLSPPRSRSAAQRLAGAAGFVLNRLQMRLSQPQPIWIHTLLHKDA